MDTLMDESPTPQPEPLTRAAILGELQRIAAELDPAHAGLYARMSTDRWLGAADLAADLMLAHCRYQRQPSGARRAHSAAIYQRLAGTNRVQLAGALALVHLPFWLLSRREQHGE